MTIIRRLRLSLEPMLRGLFRLVTVVYGYNLHRKVLYLRDYLYSMWAVNMFEYAGKGVLLFPPITIVGPKHIRIGSMTNIGKHSAITAWNNYGSTDYCPTIVIGKDCNLGEYNHISCINQITIGNGVLTGRWVTITDNNHGDNTISQLDTRPTERPLSSKGAISIGDNVWIGDKATILSGVTIGEGAIIAANSVVTQNIPQGCVAAGIPAKIIKTIK